MTRGRPAKPTAQRPPALALQRVAAKAPGIKGWIFRKLINFLVARGKKGLS